jgi:tetratricopeptide (TPR) repeat protein
MGPGDLVAARFLIESVAGTGAMGTVFRARDLQAGSAADAGSEAGTTHVALKVLRPDRRPGLDGARRFLLEARVVSGLDHPGIIRHVADGQTEAGEPFLAMEWLEGEDLSRRLSRQPLNARESVQVALQVARALGSAHGRGIVHRDIKPSNLWLVGGDVGRVKVLDFGIARAPGELAAGLSLHSTRTGMMIGTPAHMAPEQARGSRTIDARADVFALGTVLFECLTGRAAFSAGGHLYAMLAKILFEDPPALSELRPDLPAGLGALVAQLLAKDPARRPADGLATAEALEALLPLDGPPPSRGEARPAALTRGEQRLVCVVLAAGTDNGAGPPAHDDDTQTADTLPEQALDATLPRQTARLGPNLSSDDHRRARAAIDPFGARLERLLDGSLVALLYGAGNARDQAMRAARCALALRQVLPDARVVLSTGLAVVARSVPVGEVIDRAASVLERTRTLAGEAALAIRLDDVTAGLLASHYAIASDAGGSRLADDRPAEQTRTLLGRPTRCVGREAELAMLEALYASCLAEPAARVALITAPSGVGKSRLRHELVNGLLRRAAGTPEVLVGRGDPMSVGSPLGLLAQGLRRACGILGGEPPAAQQAKLTQRLQALPALAEPRRVAEFLGELAGVPFPDVASVQLRAARNDAQLMGEQMLRAFEEWLAAECACHPVVLVLEDLQWGDAGTVRFVDSALKALADRPLLVIGVGRPEVLEQFPDLWSQRELTRIPLGGLSTRASGRLVRDVLGERVSEAELARMVALAGGNAFYLEELVRTVAEGGGALLPATVVAMMQARLESLDPEARRLLRAASVFGQAFWTGGVAALLGAEGRESAAALLVELAGRELLTPRRQTRFAGEEEHVFRHDLVREAAYGTLTEADRALGHRVAGAWLESVGEPDHVVLAEHFERGGDHARAAAGYVRATLDALAASDLDAALVCSGRALRGGAEGELRGTACVLRAEALRWRAAYPEALQHAREAMTLLPVGSDRWCQAADEAAHAANTLSDMPSLRQAAQHLAEQACAPLTPAKAVALASVVIRLNSVAEYVLASELVDRLDSYEGDDPAVLAWIHNARGNRARYRGDVGALLSYSMAAEQAFRQAGDRRSALVAQSGAAYAYNLLGAYTEAVTTFRAVIRACEELGVVDLVAVQQHNLGLALARSGQFTEAIAIETRALEECVRLGNRRLEGCCRVYRSLIRTLAGELDAAEADALAALDLSRSTPPIRVQALAQLGGIHLQRQQHRQALALARDSVKTFEELGGTDEGEGLARLTYAEALHAAGEMEAAREAIRTARHRLQAAAARIADPGWRQCFLDNIPENRRTLELARRWLAEGDDGA